MSTSTAVSARRAGLRCALGLALSAALLLTVGVGAASATIAPNWCVESGGATPCIVSASVTSGGNTTSVYDNSSIYFVELSDYYAGVNGQSSGFILNVDPQTGGGPTGEDLGSAAANDTWSVVVDVGTLVPRVAYAQGQDVTFTRPTGGSSDMTITGNPVTVDDNSVCNFNGSFPSCPTNATTPDYTTFNAQVDDYHLPSEYTPAQIDSFYGMNMYTNIDETGLPPEIQSAPGGGNELVLQLANQHDYPGGAVFYGYLHLFIPDGFMEQVWGINDPTTIETDALAASIGSGTVTSTEEPGGLQIDISGITFSRRKLVIRRGVVTPTPPRELHAHRSGSSGLITFHRSRPRGDRITGYTTSCAASHHATVTAVSKRSPLKLRGLAAGTAYRCAVRARSKAGPSRPAYVKLAA